MKKLYSALIALAAGLIALVVIDIFFIQAFALLGYAFGNETQIHFDKFFWYGYKILSIFAVTLAIYFTFKNERWRGNIKLIYTIGIGALVAMFIFLNTSHHFFNGPGDLLLNWNYLKNYTP